MSKNCPVMSKSGKFAAYNILHHQPDQQFQELPSSGNRESRGRSKIHLKNEKFIQEIWPDTL
jgi:hypothetical protein